MKIHGRWFRFCSGLILCTITIVKVVGQDAAAVNQLVEELRSGRPISVDRLVLSGVAKVGGYRLASIRDAKSGAASWFTEGDLAFGYKVKQIADNHVVLVPYRGSDEQFRVSLSGVGVGLEAGPEPYSKAWINSRANPMLNAFQELPGLHREWSGLTDEAKRQIIDFYRKHGWKLERIMDLGGTTEFVWRNMYEAERVDAIKANREKFEKTLNSAQQALWKEMSKFNSIYPAERGKLSEEQKALIATRRVILDEFKDSLSPDQKAEYASITDFTKGNWK